MPPSSFNQLFRGGALTRDGGAIPRLGPPQTMAGDARRDDDELRGRVKRARKSAAGAAKLSNSFDRRLGAARRFGFRDAKNSFAGGDSRQRAIVKIHFFGHGGGGAAALAAHMRYVARDAAQRDLGDDREAPHEREAQARRREADRELRAHASYLEREREGLRAPFYDGLEDSVDGAARAAVWGREDKRHFRIILAAENGGELRDLKTYTRAVMERADACLGTRLEWVAVDHFDTDNPHSHILLRGRRADGRPLVLPRDFVKHGLRNAARDLATERLGARTREDERRALERETRAHRPTRLDALIARQIETGGHLRVSKLEAPDRDPALANALKARARELVRLGLASETRRNVFRFRETWRAQLAAMELHLDVRKQVMRQRALQSRTPSKLLPLPSGFSGLLR